MSPLSDQLRVPAGRIDGHELTTTVVPMAIVLALRVALQDPAIRAELRALLLADQPSDVPYKTDGLKNVNDRQ